MAAARLHAWAQATAGAASRAPHRATIDAAAAGTKTGVYVSREVLGMSSQTLAYKLCKGGHVTVNGRRAFATQLLRAGDDVEVIVPADSGGAGARGSTVADDPHKLAALTHFTNYLCAPERRPPCAVLYEDDHLAVVYKPAGVHTLQWAGTMQRKHLALDDALPLLLQAPRGTGAEMALTPLARPLPAHRLDARVAGCVAVAKTSLAMKGVTAQFEARAVKKEYTAVLTGNLTQSLLAGDAAATVFTFAAGAELAEWDGQVVSSVGGREAVTLVKVIRVVPCAVAGALTEVRLWPRTGRRHQLRRHCAVLGCPIVGDGLYHSAAFAGPVARRLEAVRLCARGAGGGREDEEVEDVAEVEEDIDGEAVADPSYPFPSLRKGVGLYLACTGFEMAHPATGSVVRTEAVVQPRFERLLRKAGAGHAWAAETRRL